MSATPRPPIEEMREPRRPRLSECDGISLAYGEPNIPHPVDSEIWETKGWVRFDYDRLTYSLTGVGKRHIQSSCGNCAAWKCEAGSNIGQCWSGDRLDGDMSAGPADHTRDYQTCEAFSALPSPPETEGG